MAIVVATVIASSRLLRLIFGELDILAYAGLFIACWIGSGGALVPVPGVRPISWVMIVQQGAALDPAITALVAAFAMTLGQSSYFAATRAAMNRARAARATADSPDSPDAPDPPDQSAEPAADETGMSRRQIWTARARKRIDRQIHRHGILTVFFVSALPTPLTTLTSTAAATAGMGYVRFFAASFCGFLLLSALLAFVGQGLFGGLQSLFPIFR